MNCQSAKEQITDTLAAGSVELTGDLTGHVRSCSGCGTFYARQAELFRAIDSALSAMANEPVPASLLPRVRAQMEETHVSSLWLYRPLPIAAILVIACLIAFPLVRRSFRSDSLRVAVISNRVENGDASRPPLAGQPETPQVPPEKRNGVAYFLYCIRNDRPVEGPVSPGINVGVNEIIDAAKESIRTGRAVAMPVR